MLRALGPAGKAAPNPDMHNQQSQISLLFLGISARTKRGIHKRGYPCSGRFPKVSLRKLLYKMPARSGNLTFFMDIPLVDTTFVDTPFGPARGTDDKTKKCL